MGMTWGFTTSRRVLISQWNGYRLSDLSRHWWRVCPCLLNSHCLNSSCHVSSVWLIHSSCMGRNTGLKQYILFNTLPQDYNDIETHVSMMALFSLMIDILLTRLQ
jgi:hypothetical protein